MFIFAGFSLFVFGAILGSFAVAQVWRLRAAQLADERESGEEIDKNEWKKLRSLVGVKGKNDRSHCLNCDYQLRWYDLIPIASWLSLGGKCRKCRKPIGKTEFFAEVAVALVFMAIFAAINPLTMVDFVRLLFLLVAIVFLTILFVYDAKWFLLPTKILWVFNLVALCYYLLTVFSVGLKLENILNLGLSIAVFPLVYFVLALISKEKWVGGGDWILALGLILLLPSSPFFAILALFLSNIFGLIVAALASIFARAGAKKPLSRGGQIPFGPAMISAVIFLLIFQKFFMDFLRFLV